MKFVFNILKPFKFCLVAQFLTAIIWAIHLSLSPYLIKVILNKVSAVTPDNAFSELLPPVALYVFMSFFINLVYRLYGVLYIQFHPKLKKHIGTTLFNMTIQHSHSFFQNHFAGALAAKIKNCIDFIPCILKTLIDNFFRNGLALLMAVYTVWQVNYIFALGLMAWVTLFLGVSIGCMPKVRRLSKITAAEGSRGVGHLVDILSNVINLRLFCRHEEEKNFVSGNFDKWVKAHQTRDWFLWKIDTVRGSSFFIFQTLCFYWLIKGLQQGSITAGDFALILTINISMVECLWNISKDIKEFSEHLGNVSEGLDFLQTPPEIQDQIDAKELVVTKGEIVFDNVYFCYKDTDLLFQDKSITIAPGQKVGLVGFSGSGKSTFVNLILRLFDINEGGIYIDGQNIFDVTQDSLRRNISIIPQEPALFHRNLIENIRYGRVDATDSEVVAAAKKAFAHDFIIKLPHGYKTLVGEKGMKLSGGQRQRIAIARAILRDAPILILDEATSQLDSKTEADIQESIWNLMQGKTTVVIAHRLSTLVNMDRLIVFHDGQIVEDGTHDSLLHNNGLYKMLWDAQVGGLLPEHDFKISNVVGS